MNRAKKKAIYKIEQKAFAQGQEEATTRGGHHHLQEAKLGEKNPRNGILKFLGGGKKREEIPDPGGSPLTWKSSKGASRFLHKTAGKLGEGHAHGRP